MLEAEAYCTLATTNHALVVLGGVMVIMLAIGPKVRGFKPG
jgi:hypothetical protein